MIQYVQTFAYIVAILLPFIMPNVFFKSRHDKVKLIFYNVVRSGDNPFPNEPTSISLYDPDAQQHFEVDDIYDNESYEQFCDMISKMTAEYTHIYFITYNIENKETCFKLIMEEFLECMPKKIRFMDLKKIFYSVHQNVSKIMYNDVLDYYRVPEVHCRSLEYCAIFDQLIQDFDINFKDDMSNIGVLYNIVYPLAGL